MSKKIQKRDAEASKALIISSAIELFSKKGYASTSMDELAKLSGLNKAMVFYYFKNKKGLYEAVIYAKYACTHSYLPSLLLKELSDSGAVLPPKILFGAMRELFSLFSDILKRGEEQCYFHNAIPMMLYFMVIGTLNLMITTKALRVEASQKEDILLDTCAISVAQATDIHTLLDKLEHRPESRLDLLLVDKSNLAKQTLDDKLIGLLPVAPNKLSGMLKDSSIAQPFSKDIMHESASFTWPLFIKSISTLKEKAELLHLASKDKKKLNLYQRQAVVS